MKFRLLLCTLLVAASLSYVHAQQNNPRKVTNNPRVKAPATPPPSSTITVVDTAKPAPVATPPTGTPKRVAAISTPSTSERIEFSLDNVADDHQLYALGDDGFIVYFISDEKAAPGKKKFYCIKYDTDLKEEYRLNIPIDKGASFARALVKDNSIYLLYTDGGRAQAYSKTGVMMNQPESYVFKEFEVVKVEYKEKKISSTKNSFPKKLYVSEFNITGERAYFSTYKSSESNDKILGCATALVCMPAACFFFMKSPSITPYTFSYNMKGNSMKVIAFDKKDKVNVIDASVDDSLTEYYALVKKTVKKNDTYFLRTISTDKVQSDKVLPVKGTNKLLNAKVTHLPGEEKLVVGMYGQKTGKYSFVTNGFYITKFKGSKSVFCNFYNYKDIKSLNPAGSGKKLKASSAPAPKNAKKPKREPSMYVRYLVHEAIKVDYGYVLVAEGYSPEYHYVTYVDAQGHSHTQQVFDGWRYQNCVVMGYDENGKLLWDNAFESSNILSYQLRERVKTYIDDDGLITLAYSFKDEIIIKKVLEDNTIEASKKVPITTGNSKDKVKKSEGYNEDISYWYDNYFIAYGTQKVVTKEKKNKKRNVFYVNKISF